VSGDATGGEETGGTQQIGLSWEQVRAPEGPEGSRRVTTEVPGAVLVVTMPEDGTVGQ
jgi:hypothetical protein